MNTPTPPHQYPDLMIDIEALADTPDSAPAEIALLFFDRDDRNRPFTRFTYEPKPLDAIHLGFNVTPDTLKWWDKNGLVIDVNHGEPLHDVLDEITRDIQTFGKPGLRVWSRGNAYDLSILRLAFARTGRPLPWDYWNDRDVRTWLEGCQFKSPRKNNHDAAQDAENQALDVIEATAAIPEVRTTPTDFPMRLLAVDVQRDGIWGSFDFSLAARRFRLPDGIHLSEESYKAFSWAMQGSNIDVVTGIYRAILITADKPGSGKSCLARKILSYRFGECYATCQPESEGEWNGALIRAMEKGYLFIDNFQGLINSRTLLHFLNTEEIEYLPAGQDTPVRKKNTLQVVICGNSLIATEAIHRKSIFITPETPPNPPQPTSEHHQL